MLIALASVKASPGVTTTAVALAAAWPAPRRLILEADPAGGDLCAWLDLPPAPGLASLAAARSDRDPAAAWQHAQDLGGGLSVLAAPVGPEQSAACLTALTRTGLQIPGSAISEPGVVIADCGRLDPGSPALAIAAQAAVTLLLVRPRVSELFHLPQRAETLARAGLRLGLLLAPTAGRGPAEVSYAAAEIAASMGLPVEGSLPDDLRGAAALIRSRGTATRSRRQPLARAVAGLAAALAARTSPPPAGPEPGPARGCPHPGEVTAGDLAR